jgi:hypothetical protein
MENFVLDDSPNQIFWSVIGDNAQTGDALFLGLFGQILDGLNG